MQESANGVIQTTRVLPSGLYGADRDPDPLCDVAVGYPVGREQQCLGLLDLPVRRGLLGRQPLQRHPLTFVDDQHRGRRTTHHPSLRPKH